MSVKRMIEEHYRERRDNLVKIFANRAGGDYNAEDVVQIAFERALRYKSSFRPDVQEFGAWFNTIINNSLRDFKMDERRMGMGGAKDVVFGGRCELEEGTTLSTELDGMSRDTIALIKKDIESKDMPVRQALFLYLFRQYKPREIAKVLDMSNGSIRQAVMRFKAEVSAKYGEKSDGAILESFY